MGTAECVLDIASGEGECGTDMSASWEHKHCSSKECGAADQSECGYRHLNFLAIPDTRHSFCFDNDQQLHCALSREGVGTMEALHAERDRPSNLFP